VKKWGYRDKEKDNLFSYVENLRNREDRETQAR